MARPFWMQLHTDDLLRFRTTARRMLPALLGVYVLIIFVFTIKLFRLPYLRLSAISNLDALRNTEVVEFVRLVFGFGIAEWLVTVLSLGLLLVWMALGYLAWILTRLILEYIWQWFYPTDPDFFLNYCRMTRFLHRALWRPNLVVTAITTLLAASLLVKSRIWALTPERGAIVIGIALLAAVPCIYTVHWFLFAGMLRRHPRASNLGLYFFSQHTARRKLKNSVDMLVFLALLSWIWIPTYFTICKGLSDKTAFAAREILDYQGKWTTLSRKIEFSSPGNERWMLSAPSQFAERLDFSGTIQNAFPLTQARPIFQKYLFAIIMFSTLFELAIPAVYNTVRMRGYRVAFRRILVASIKTAVFLAILQVFVLKTYFVDMSETVGLGATFALIIAVAISQDEQFYKKWKKRRTKRSG